MKGCLTFLLILVLIAAFLEYWPIILIIITIYIVYQCIQNIRFKKSKYNNIDFDLMDGHQFEYFCADLLRDNGFSGVKVTPGSGDHGVDIIAYKSGNKYAIQCKCYTNNVGNHAVQEVYSGMAIYKANIAVVMTNSNFTNQARSDARKLGVQLWDRTKINNLIRSAKGDVIEIQQIESHSYNVSYEFTQEELASGVENINNIENGGVHSMYNKEKGIFPPGNYLVGDDIDTGKYLLTSRNDKIGSITIYENYSKYKNDELLSYQSFDSDYHLSLRENGLFIIVENADIQKI